MKVAFLATHLSWVQTLTISPQIPAHIFRYQVNTYSHHIYHIFTTSHHKTEVLRTKVEAAMQHDSEPLQPECPVCGSQKVRMEAAIAGCCPSDFRDLSL